MRRIALTAALSLLAYGFAFACLLDRPRSLGYLREQIDTKLARGADQPSPKLVILAGSNAPYSHRCETMEPILHMPCVNGGVAVGLGLDYLFTRWKPMLRPGDIVYLPMEEDQYARSGAATLLGPDAAIMLRHDRETLAKLPPARWLAALFSGDLRSMVMSVIEMAMVAGGFQDPRAEATGSMNAWGDHIGHTPGLGAANAAMLNGIQPKHPSAAAIRAGDGSAIITAFLAWARSHGVEAVGGLSTGFADSPPPSDTLEAIASLYRENGARFLELPNLSRYPRSAFFDTAEHLNEPAQIVHSRLVARALVSVGTQASAIR